MQGLDYIARRFGMTPADIIGEAHPMKALSINLWAYNFGVQEENRQAEMLKAKTRWRR